MDNQRKELNNEEMEKTTGAGVVETVVNKVLPVFAAATNLHQKVEQTKIDNSLEEAFKPGGKDLFKD